MIGLLDRGCIHCGTSIESMWDKPKFQWISNIDDVEGFICGKCGHWSSYLGGNQI